MLRGSWRRRQQVREEVTGKLVPVEFELYQADRLAAVGRVRLTEMPFLRVSVDSAIANGGSMRVSVCPSVTVVSHAKTVQVFETRFAPYDRAMLLFS